MGPAMKVITTTLFILSLLPATNIFAKDSVVTSKKTFESELCSAWDLKRVQLEDKELIVYFLDNVDVCSDENGDIHSYSIPRTILSAEYSGGVTIAFAAATRSENCLGKIDPHNYSIEYGINGDSSKEVVIVTKGQGASYRNIAKVCVKIFVELSK